MENLAAIHPSRTLQTTDDNLHDGYSSAGSSSSSSTLPENSGKGVWSKEEHARFLEAITIYANGPWKVVAAYVGTRTVRQTMTHAQKYRQKAARRLRGLRTKQALMRMHFGHRVSEESLVQERLRSLGMLQRGRLHRSPAVAVTVKAEPMEVLTHEPSAMQSPPSVDAFEAAVSYQSLLEELADSPSLDECVSELMTLLF